jgi:site-specific DNA recombinase
MFKNGETAPFRVGLYIRVSTQEQAQEGYSIDAQTDRLTNFCKAKDWTVYKVYTDPGYSGSNMIRPALEQIISDIEQHNIDCVLVYKLDRLSRSQKDTLFLIEDVFLKNKVEFVSVNENFDTSTPFGRATIGMLSVFAQLEREQIKERSLMGRTERAKNGYWHGGGHMPFGYDYINGELIINEFQAMQVKEAYEMFLNDVSIYQITTALSAKYGTIKHESTVRSILTTPLYGGIIHWHDQNYKGKHQEIIDMETFNKVQQKYNSRKWQRKSTHPATRVFQCTTLLGGLLFCGNCGARYFSKGNYSGHGAKKKYYPYYYCYSRAKTCARLIIDPNCKNPAYAIKKLDKTIIDEVKNLALDIEYFNLIRNSQKTELLSKSANDIIYKRIMDVNTQIARLLDLYQLGTIPLDTINSRVQSLQDDKKSLESQIVAEEKSTKMSSQAARDILDNIGDIFENGTFEEKRKIIHGLISKIVVLDTVNEFKIYWNF